MRRRRGLRLWIGVVGALLTGCGAGAWRPSISGRWLELETPHFVIDTDLGERRARSMAQALEDSRAALLASAWSGAKDPRGRTRVLVFARQRELSRYAGRNNQGVVLTRPGFERLLAFSAGRAGDVPKVAVHELVHDISRWFLPLQPLWLAEGLALYLEGIEIDRADGQVVMGGLSRDSLAWLRYATFLPSTSELLSKRDSSSADPRDTAPFYLGSWALVHYLLDEEPEAFGRFQKALARLTPWRSAWHRSFPGLTEAELDARLLGYLQAGRFVTTKTRFTPPVFTPRVRVLSPAEVHGARALLANTSGQPIGERELAAALELDPDTLDGLTVRFHSLRANAQAARSEIARRAVQAHPRDARAWWLATLAGSDLEERRSSLARAQRLDPDHPGVVGLLAEDALARNDPNAALFHVRHAQRRSGVTHQNLALQFAALAASSRCQGASILEPSSFEPVCRLSLVAGQPEVSCADVVQRVSAARASCSSGPL